MLQMSVIHVSCNQIWGEATHVHMMQKNWSNYADEECDRVIECAVRLLSICMEMKWR